MKFLAPLLMLAASAIAAPVAKTPKTFHLKTTSATKAEHNDLYVYGYHTGAGLNDAVLTQDVGTASSAYLNGTNVVFDYKTEFPWGMIAVGNTNYASWQPIQINAGTGTDGFSIDNGLLQWSEDMGFGGWLVCDWFHNAPQLFYLYKYYDPIIPSSCSKVQVKVEYPK
ncbi:hypothetical protein PENANT_c074G11108 [Penicillium antarcticum]|uniref:DUF7907 domain-containing protein n=1 Tax=Penicillium antarcticum TaxID=416450 RepID=A0A1V6PQR1_9EURO|nr:uncharacterized protein N7508_001949 [Penicillium antarcticum]KAJ5317441.1 hypothetical protein N7508_001949 [Penicillium antarcticum]OQD78886.1 hypothetical protein PENANT_c074G11108 [Penicillium antarcticum]